MRVVAITTPGEPDVLELQERPRPEPDPGGILVAVRAAGVNRADLIQRRGHYPPPPGWPEDVPGLEYAGAVAAVGRGVELWEVGDRVMGLVGGGGYAEYVAVHEREAIRIPDSMSFEEAAAVPEVFITAHDALFTQMELSMGERLLIHAVGSGVGTAATQLAKAVGTTVVGTSRSAWKLKRAQEELGLDVAISTADGGFAEEVARRTGGEGIHVILDLVGGDYFPDNVRCLAERGRVIVVGLVAGRTSQIDLGALLANRLHVVGTSLRRRSLEEKIMAARLFEKEVVPLLEAGRVHPVLDEVFPLEAAAEAHRRMEENANFGKIVLDLGESGSAG